MPPTYLTILIPCLTVASTLIGLGVLWGALRTQVAHLREEVDRMSDHLDRQDHLLTGLQEEVRVKFAQQAAKASAPKPKRRK